MKQIDALFHPIFTELRYSSEINLYKPLQIEPEKFDGKLISVRHRSFHIEHIKLDLQINEQEKAISGKAAITLKPFLNGLQEVRLDAVGLSVSQVLLDNHPLSFETDPNQLIITLERAYTSEERLTLIIAYSAKPKKGLFFIEPDDAYPNRPCQVWSQGQPDDNAHWFPCCSMPADKYSSELSVTVNNRFIALSNGQLIQVSEDRKRSTKTFHWQQDQPHPSYLFSLVVGEYEETRTQVDGLELLYYIYKDHKEKAERIFGRTPAMLHFFAERFSHPYPFAKYSQAVVAEFTFGGMENTSATTLTDWVLTDDQVANDISYDDLIAHELAHQWYGNLVTCKSWQHNWLNEGFATYAEALWLEQAGGREDAALHLLQDHNQYLRQDLGEYRRSVISDCCHYAIDLFDRHAYQKGALILHMLRHMLGDEAFFKALKHYLHKHAFQAAETHDLKIAIEEVTGYQLDTFFQQWLYGCGYPEFEVRTEWQPGPGLLRLTVRQTQQLDDRTPLFRVPVDIELTTTKGNQLVRIMVERAEADYYFHLDSKPLMVVFDKGDYLIKTLRFTKSKQEYLYQLQHDSEVLGRMRAARELAAYDDETVIDKLATVLQEDTCWGVRVAAAITLGEISNVHARNALQTGYQQNSSARVRRACVWGLGNQPPDDALIDFLYNVVEHDQSYFVVAVALQAIANTRSERAFDLLASALSRDSYREVIRSATFLAFTHLEDKRAISHALTFSEYGRPAPAREAAIRALSELGKGNEQVYQHLTKLLKDPSWRVRLQSVKALGKLGDKRALPLLKAIEENEAIDHIKSVACTAIRTLATQSEKQA
ncbi:MAG: M1 family aminopeptidase [Acidobacteriota bacterium]